MQKIINTILKAAIAVLAMTLAASCIFEKENPIVKGGVKTVMVQFDVNSSGMVQTKAPIIEGDDEPEATEIKTLRVFAYTKKTVNNVETYSLCGFLYLTGAQIEAASTTALLMDIRLPYTQMNSEQTIYFRAVANAEGMTGTDDMLSVSVGRNEDGSMTMSENIGYDELGQITFGINNQVTDGITTQSFGNGMPMYCETQTTVNLNTQGTEVTDVPGHVSHTKLPAPIKVSLQLTRSLAKIDVYAAEASTKTASGDSDAGIQITSVQLVNPVAAGKLFPGTPSTPAQNATAAMTISTPNVTKAVIAAENSIANKYTRITNSYYIAENAAGTAGKFSYGQTTADATLATEAAGATALKIGYKVSATAETEYGYVVMPPIARNTWYKVLARITANGKLAFDLNVLDWVPGAEVDVDFDNVVAHDESYGFKWFKGKTEVTNNVVNGTYTFSSAADDEVTCKFKLTAPIGGKWYATLAGGDIQKYSIEGGSGDIEGGEMSFTIKTLTNNFDGESPNQVNLVITAVNTVGKSNVIDDFSYIIKQSQTN